MCVLHCCCPQNVVFTNGCFLFRFPTMYFFYPKANVLNNPELGEYEDYEGPRHYETVTAKIKERLAGEYVYYNASVLEDAEGNILENQAEEHQRLKLNREKEEATAEKEAEMEAEMEEGGDGGEGEEEDFTAPLPVEFIEEDDEEEEEEEEENQMSAKEMRSAILLTVGKIGNPDSLLKILEYANRIELQDEEDDFENVDANTKEEL